MCKGIAGCKHWPAGKIAGGYGVERRERTIW
jgi:hypothetical protein